VCTSRQNRKRLRCLYRAVSLERMGSSFRRKPGHLWTMNWEFSRRTTFVCSPGGLHLDPCTKYMYVQKRCAYIRKYTYKYVRACMRMYTFTRTFSFLQFLRSRLMAGIISFPYKRVSDRSAAVIRSLRFHGGQSRRLVVRDPP